MKTNALSVVSVRAWFKSATVFWMDSDGDYVLARVNDDRVQCLRLSGTKTKLLWTRRAPTIWAAFQTMRAGEITVDWTRKLWFATCSSNDSVGADKRVCLASFSLVTGQLLYQSAPILTIRGSDFISVAADSKHALVWIMDRAENDERSLTVSRCSYQAGGLLYSKVVVSKTLHLQVNMRSVTFDAAYQTLVAVGDDLVFAIGVRTWSIKEFRIPRCQSGALWDRLRAHRGRLYVLSRQRVWQLCSARKPRKASSAPVDCVAMAFAVTAAGLLMIPSLRQLRSEQPEALIGALRAPAEHGRAYLREVLHWSTRLPREIAAVVSRYHGFFLDHAPTVFCFRLPSKALSGTTSRAFWDDELGRLSFLAIPDAESYCLLDSVSLLSANICTRNYVVFGFGERMCHFGMSGLWTRLNDEFGAIAQRDPQTGVLRNRVNSPTSSLAYERNCVQFSPSEAAQLAVHSRGAKIDVRLFLSKREPWLTIAMPSAAPQRSSLNAVGFARKAQVLVWAAAQHRLVMCSCRQAPTARILLKAHWPVGLHDAVCFERPENNNTNCALTAHPHDHCENGSIRRVAVTEDAMLIWLLIGDLVVMLSARLGTDFDNLVKGARAVHIDDLATAAGLRTPWDAEDLFVDPVSNQVFVSGGSTVLSFPPCWFSSVAQRLAVPRVIRPAFQS